MFPKTQTPGPEADTPVSRVLHLHPGEVYAGSGPVVVHTLLGSCVAVCLWDSVHRVGGMNHVMLPVCRDGSEPTSKYGNVATFLLRDILVAQGGAQRHLKARIFGGAQSLSRAGERTGLAVGGRNLEVTRAVLRKLGIPITSEDCGGTEGRKIRFDLQSGIVRLSYIRHYDFKVEERVVTREERRHDVWNHSRTPR